MRPRSTAAIIGPSTSSNASNTPGSVGTFHPRWPWTSRLVAIPVELTVQDRVAEHSRSSKGRPNPRAQLTTSYSADSAGQSHGRDESACLILAKQSQRTLSRVLARLRDPSRSLDTGAYGSRHAHEAPEPCHRAGRRGGARECGPQLIFKQPT